MLKIWVVTDQRQFWRERWRCGCGKPTSFPGSLFLSQNNRSWEWGWWQTRWCGKWYRKRLLKGSLRTVAWAAMFGSGFDKTFQFSIVNLWTSVAEGHAPFEKYKFAKSFLMRVALVCLNKVCFLLFFFFCSLFFYLQSMKSFRIVFIFTSRRQRRGDCCAHGSQDVHPEWILALLQPR